MARKIIGSIWDRSNRNDLNTMLEELYDNIFLFKEGTKFIKTDHLEDGSITFDKMGLASVGTAALRDNSVSTSKIPNKAVTEEKLGDGSVTVDKLGVSSVGTLALRDNSVSTRKIPNKAITSEKLDDGSVTVDKLGVASVSREKIRDNAINMRKISFSKSTKNLFDGSFIYGFSYFNPSGDFPLGSIHKTTLSNARAAVVKVDKDTDYTITIYQGGNNFRIALINEIPNEDNIPVEVLKTHLGEQSSTHRSYTITNDVNAEYLFVLTNLQSSVDALVQIEKGVHSTSYVPNAYIPKEYIDPTLLDGIEVSPTEPGDTIITHKDDKFNFSGKFNEIYEHDAITNLVNNISNIQTSEVNTLFNNLVSENSDIGISKRLGADESGTDTYMIESVPPSYNDAPYNSSTRPNDGVAMGIPKIVITGGIHGNEKSPPISIYYFLKTLWENPKNDPTIDALVQNVHFVFIPIVGAEGYDNATYNNGTNHLNRDFPPHGSATRLATQMTKSALDANADMDFFIDFHNMFARDGMLGYVLTNDDLWKRIGTNIYKDIGIRWSKKYSEIPKDRSQKFAVATEANNGTIGRYVQDVIEKPAGLLEVPRRNPFDESAEEFDDFIIRLGVDILFNAVYSLIRSKQ